MRRAELTIPAAALLVLAPLLSAFGQPAGGALEVRFRDFIPPSLRVWTRDGKATFTLSEGATERLRHWETLDVLSEGRYLRLELDERELVVGVDLLDPDEVSAPFEPAGEPVASPMQRTVSAQVMALARELVRGDPILVDGRRFVFDSLGGMNLFTRRPGEAPLVIHDLREVRRLERAAASAGTSGPAPEAPEAFKPGDTVEIIDQLGERFVGIVIFADARVVELETHPEGQQIELPREGLQIRATEIEEVPPPGQGSGSDTAAPEGPPPAPDKVTELHGQPQPDGDANVYRVFGRVAHSEQERLLLKVMLTVTARSQQVIRDFRRVRPGRLAPPALEEELLERYPAPSPEGVEHFGVAYYPLEIAGGLVFVKLETLDDVQTIELGPIFPGLPTQFEATTALLNPTIHIEVSYREEDFVPFSDARATAALVSAYANAKGQMAELMRRRALSGMAVSRDPDLVSFLFWSHYLEDGDPEQLATTVASFGEVAEAWLYELLSTKGWEGAIEVLTPEGKLLRTPQNPDLALASLLELMGALGSERALTHALQALRTSTSPEVRAAARALFVELRAPPVAWLISQLRPNTPVVRDLLMEIEERRQGQIIPLYERVEDPEPIDPAQLTGLTAGEVVGRYLDRLAVLMQDRKYQYSMNPVLQRAFSSSNRVQSALEQLARLRRQAASGLISLAHAPPPDQDHRHWSAEQLSKALIYDPESASARLALAPLVREVLSEFQQAAALRLGPGEDWARLRAVQEGEVFVFAEDAPAVPEWIAVHTDSGVSYVSESAARKGRSRVLAVRGRRPAEEQLRILQQAVSLDTASAATHEERVVALMTQLGSEAAALGEWSRALEQFAQAAARQPAPELVLYVVTAYLHVHPWVPASGLVLVFVFLLALLVKRPKQADDEAAGGASAVAAPAA